MKEFIEKWKTDSRFKIKAQLGLYTSFVIIVAVFALATQPKTVPENLLIDSEKNNQENQTSKKTLTMPDEYKYKIEISINDNIYKFEGTKEKTKESFKKTHQDNTTNYMYVNENYYKEYNEEYIIVNEAEIYEEIHKNYIEFDTINQYLTKATTEDNVNKIYLKDIILGNSSEEYITITLNENANKKEIFIDYTSLMKHFDKSIEKYEVNIEIE